MKKSVVFAIHVVFWCAYVLLLWVIAAAVTQGFTTGPSLKYMARLGLIFAIYPFVSGFYLFYGLVFPTYLKTKKIMHSFVYGVLMAAGTALLGGGWLLLWFKTKTLFNSGLNPFVQEVIFIFFMAFIGGVLGVIIKGFITWYQDIKLKEELNFKNHQMELALLKSQLDPHFLFNTINNIDVLILKSPELASVYLNKLSDLLRFMLYESKFERIALNKEIEYIQQYIALQKIRTANENFVSFTVSGNTANHSIPALLLIPFIENAFKHVSNKKTENAITISLRVEDDELIFECSNHYHSIMQDAAKNQGIGNELIQKRIALLYPKKHTLVTQQHNNTYTVNLVLTNV